LNDIVNYTMINIIIVAKLGDLFLYVGLYIRKCFPVAETKVQVPIYDVRTWFGQFDCLSRLLA